MSRPPRRRRPCADQLTPPPDVIDVRYERTYQALCVRYVPVVAAVLAHEQCEIRYVTTVPGGPCRVDCPHPDHRPLDRLPTYKGYAP